MSNAAAKARLRMWLRSERAMGLDAAPIRPQPAPSASGLSGAASIQTTAPDAPETPAPLFESPDIPAPQLLTGPSLSRAERIAALEAVNREVAACKRCGLCKQRTLTVFGEGDPEAKIVFIGEGPGETEDLSGRPFVGRAGTLLDKMIAGMGLKREEVYICNVVKCRPPGNRTPAPDEVETCTPFLVRQLSILRPRVIVTLGLPASRYMLKSTSSMGSMRGRWHSWRGVKLMPTYHPAFLLRSYTEENRRAVWSDLQQVMAEIGLKARK